MSKETTRAPAAAVGNVVKLRSRKAKLTPSETEALDRFNARRLEVALIQWPEIPPPRDWDSQTNEELADIDFEAIAEFRGDGHGCGTRNLGVRWNPTFTYQRLSPSCSGDTRAFANGAGAGRSGF